MLDKTIKISVFILLISSFTLAAEIEEEIIVEAKKLDSISDWKEDVSSTSLNSEEIIIVEAQHPKQIFNRVPGVWISRGSGQEHLTAIRSPVLTGPGACGSFLILEEIFKIELFLLSDIIFILCTISGPTYFLAPLKKPEASIS